MLTLEDFPHIDKLPKPGSRKDTHKHLRSKLPIGSQDNWEIQRFEVEKGLGLLRLMRDGRGTVPGWYTRLIRRDPRDSVVVMSDTDAELADLKRLFTACRKFPGTVLIHGLGLGIALQGVLALPGTTHVDVVENSPAVLALVADHFRQDERITFHQADCLTYKWPKGQRWNTVWHDIWDNIQQGNLPTMKLLTRRFAGRCDWQHCWAREWID